jgi:hypothetical protein
MRATKGLDFTGRRNPGAATGLTSNTFFLATTDFLATTFFRAADLLAGAFLLFAALREEGALSLPPFLNLPFAMRSFPLPVESDTHTQTTGFTPV